MDLFNLINNNTVSEYIYENVDNKIEKIVSLTHDELELNNEEIIDIEANKIRVFIDFENNSDNLDLFIGQKDDYINQRFEGDGEKYYLNIIERKINSRLSGIKEDTIDDFSIVNFFYNYNKTYDYKNFLKKLTDNENRDITMRLKYQKYIERYIKYYTSELELKEKQFNYVLLLNNKKIYIGYSNNIAFRITSHFINSFMSPKFVKDNQPIMKILYLKPGDRRVENKIVKVLKKKYGEDNVYGR